MLLYNTKAGYICCCCFCFSKISRTGTKVFYFFSQADFVATPTGSWFTCVRGNTFRGYNTTQLSFLRRSAGWISFFIRVAGHFSPRSPSTLIRRFISRVVCSSNMGKRSRQRQKNQPAGRDDRDSVRFTLLLQQLLLMLGRKCSFRPRLITFIY